MYKRWTCRSLIVVGMCLFAFLSIAHTENAKGETSSQSSGPLISKDVYYGTDGTISGPPAPKLTAQDYPKLNLPYLFNESRLIIWVVAQQHLYYGSLILGGFFWIMLLELASLVTGKKETALWCDRFAYEIFQILILIFSVVVILGVLLSSALLSLYPGFTKYFVGTFRPFFMIYGQLFLVFSVFVYIYFISWQKITRGFLKWLHACAGLVINFVGIAAMMLANSWSTFMMAPAGVDAQGRFLGSYTHLLHNALWNPFNVHRFFGNLIFSSAVIGAYTAYQAMKSKSDDKRAYYDWASYLTLLSTLFAFFTVPFGGYRLFLKIYEYRQQMGITLSGGLLAWMLWILAMVVGLLFLAVNYSIWQRIDPVGEGNRYERQKTMAFFVLIVSLLVYITPHTLVMKAFELKAIGGQQHPIVGNFGVESAKQTAINIMIAVTIWTLILWWRSKYEANPKRIWIDSLLLGLFVAGGINILWLGVLGYYIPANVRVGLSIPMVITYVSLAIFGSLLTLIRFSGAQKSMAPTRKTLSSRGYFALFFLAGTVTWIMGLGGYLRSSVRLFWHIMEIMRDNSSWAFTHPMGFAANMITFNTLLFWCGMVFIFWLANPKESSQFRT
ncbi:MAG: cytochrome ubiquinol oxidase subunit I [Nitrospiria bacterium]